VTTVTVTSVTKDSPGVGQVTIVGTYTDVDHTAPSQQVTVGDIPTTNPLWSRACRLTNSVLSILRNGASGVAFYVTSLSKIARALENTLTWAPRITSEPEDAATAFAKAMLTLSGTVANAETVTVNGRMYTFLTVLTGGTDEVLIGASAAASLDNLKMAVNRTTPAISNFGGSGPVVYSVATAHTTVQATTNTDTTQLFEALAVGTAGNAYTMAEAIANGTVTSPFSGGLAAATFTVVAVSEDSGQTYQWQFEDATVKALGLLTSNTVAPADGDTVRVGDTTYTFKTALTSPAVANEVLIGASAAIALDNLKSAVNATAGAGTTYGTGTVANAQATATTNTDTTQLFEALVAGEAANAYVTTKDSINLKWGAPTLVNGGWASATGTINGCVYTNDTTATLTCTPTTTGQTGKAHRCAVTNASGTTGSDEATLTIS